MKLGSLFDGIGGFPLAASRYGIIPVWASEIEPFPIKVTQHHFPDMRHLGDITQINGGEIEPVDIITFGSPCTRLSVAGRHDGFDITFECQGTKDEPHKIYTNNIRATDKYQYTYKDSCPICGKELIETNESALFFHAIRIISEMREATNGTYPRFIIWENVPGAFSSNKGEDFRAVLEEIAEAEIPMPGSGKWATAGMVRTERVDVAWRTLDAQYWGVPQRRKRIFLVADFGGQCAGEILFVEEGLRGDIAESGKARQEAAGTARGGTCFAIDHVITTGGNCTAQGPCVKENGPMFTLKAAGCHSVAATVGEGTEDAITFRNVAGTLRANAGAPKHEADWEQLVCQSIGIDAYNFAESGDIAVTLTANSGSSPTHAGPAVMVSGIIPFDTTQITSPQNGNNPKPNDPCHPLCANAHVPSIAIPKQIDSTPEGIAGAVSSKWAKGTGGPAGDECYNLIIEPRSQDGVCGVHNDGVVPTLNTAQQGGTGVLSVYAIDQQGGKGTANYEINKCPTLCSDSHGTPHAVAFQPGNISRQAGEEKSLTLGCNNDQTVFASYWDGGQISDCLDCSMLAKGQMMPEKRRFPAVLEPQLYDMTHADEVMRPVEKGIAPTLNSRMGTGGNQVPVMLATIQNATRGKSQNGLGVSQDDVSYTLDGINEEVSFTLNTIDRHAVAVDCRNLCENEELSGTLQSKPNGGHSLNYQDPVRIGYAVRRLTPLECLRLMGFPDYWLDIEGMSDTQKYRAVGNSVAIPCVDFVMSGIARVLGRRAA